MSQYQRFDFAFDFVVLAGAGDKCKSFLWAALQCRFKQFLYQLPLIGSHVSYSPISRRNQARATLQSRLTVLAEIPSAAAVSSTLKPLKNLSSTISAC